MWTMSSVAQCHNLLRHCLQMFGDDIAKLPGCQTVCWEECSHATAPLRTVALHSFPYDRTACTYTQVAPFMAHLHHFIYEQCILISPCCFCYYLFLVSLSLLFISNFSPEVEFTGFSPMPNCADHQRTHNMLIQMSDVTGVIFSCSTVGLVNCLIQIGPCNFSNSMMYLMQPESNDTSKSAVFHIACKGTKSILELDNWQTHFCVSKADPYLMLSNKSFYLVMLVNLLER